MEIRQIAIEEIIPTADNPRQNVKGPGYDRLMESIKAIGIQVPVLVRYIKALGIYDLRAGARRLAVCKELGIKEIPAIVKEMTDEQAFDVTYAENFRPGGDLTPFEQADAVKTMLEKCQGSIQMVADKLSKSVKEIKMLINVGEISPAWKKSKDGAVLRMSAEQLGFFARFPKERQQYFLENLRSFMDGSGNFFPVKALEKELMNSTAKIALLPWAGTGCEKCKKRSDVAGQLDLWGDGNKGKQALCLDLECLEAKKGDFLKQIVDGLIKKGHKPKCKGYNPHLTDLKLQGFYEGTPDIQKAGAESDGAFPVVDYESGSVAWFKQKPPQQRKGSPRIDDNDQDKENSTPQENLAKKRDLWAVNRIIDLLGNVKPGEVDDNLDKHKLATLPYLSTLLAYMGGREFEENPFKKALKNGSGQPMEAVKAVFSALIPSLISHLTWRGPICALSATVVAEAREVAKYMLGLDVEKLWAGAVQENPEPKSWAKKAADEKAMKGKAKSKKADKPTPANLEPEDNIETQE